MAYFDEVRKALALPSLDVDKKFAGGEGLTPDYLSFRNTYWGQSQPISYALLWRVYLESPEVSGAINTLVDAVVGDGWSIKPLKRKKGDFSDPQDESIIEDFQNFLKANEFVVTQRAIVASMVIFGDAYVELVREGAERYGFDVEDVKDNKGNVVGENVKRAYKLLADGSEAPVLNFNSDWYKEYETRFKKEARRRKFIAKALREFKELVPSGKPAAGAGDSVSQVGDGMRKELGRVIEFYPRAAETIQIDYNEHGEVIKFIQRVKHRRVDYYPDEMIHFPMNPVGNRVYGQSPLMALVYSLQTKFSAEGYTYDFFRRGMMPRMIYVAKNLSEEQVKRMRQGLEQIKPQQDIVIAGDVEPKPVAPTNQDLQFKDLLKYLREQIFIALQVPPTLLGLNEGSNRNTSQTQMEMFDRKKKTLKTAIEEIINNKLFTYENFGVDAHFSFNEDNTREELKKAQTFQLLANSAFVHPNEVRAVYDLPPLEDEELKKIGSLKTAISPPPVSPFGGSKPGMPGNQPGKKSNAVSGSSNPEHRENAEVQNVEQQKENKMFKSGHIDAEIAESKGELDRIDQGSITRRGSTYNVGEDRAVDRERARYPYGATKIESTNPYAERHQYAIHRTMEIVREMLNALNPDNSFSLNTDRADYGDPENPNPPKHGVKPADSISAPTYERLKDPERDEVNDKGRKVWAAADGEKNGNA